MIGIVAACLTTLAFLPQVIKVMQTKETKGLSTLMCSMQTAGIGLWTIHGFLRNDLALLSANSISFILVVIILFHKLRSTE
ncbi:hypothetical protein IGI39_004176 [Enterococcus sp. AZ135]|uniref:SemiSWEET transporter n=1 Tax=unclassified Enterococcus TaxID=2608891 RepID=UPI003F25F754